jgi:hypothetical protein
MNVHQSQYMSILQTCSAAACEQAREELLRGGCIGSTAAPASAGVCSAAHYRLEITLQFPEVAPSNFVQGTDAGSAVHVTFASIVCSCLHTVCRRLQLH